MDNNKYVFICNNDKWNFYENVKEEGHIETWKCTKSVKVGDECYIHLGGDSIKEKGIVAVGVVASDPYIDEEEDSLVADLQIEQIFEAPVFRFRQGAYQVQSSCGKVREEIYLEIEEGIEAYLQSNI